MANLDPVRKLHGRVKFLPVVRHNLGMQNRPAVPLLVFLDVEVLIAAPFKIKVGAAPYESSYRRNTRRNLSDLLVPMKCWGAGL